MGGGGGGREAKKRGLVGESVGGRRWIQKIFLIKFCNRSGRGGGEGWVWKL